MSGVRTLIFLRHGETVAGSSTRYWGATDVALSQLGIEQMRRAAPVIASFKPQRVYTSSLCRTRDAARIVMPGLPATALGEFDEINFGRWEGLTREEIAATDPDGYALWQQRDENFRYPGGESLAEFRSRVERGLERVLLDSTSTTLVIAHRGVIARCLAYLLRSEQPRIAGLLLLLGSLHVLHRGTSGIWTAEHLDYCAHLEAIDCAGKPPAAASRSTGP